jgi:hypothetical protein
MNAIPLPMFWVCHLATQGMDKQENINSLSYPKVRKYTLSVKMMYSSLVKPCTRRGERHGCSTSGDGERSIHAVMNGDSRRRDPSNWYSLSYFCVFHEST